MRCTQHDRLSQQQLSSLLFINDETWARVVQLSNVQDVDDDDGD